MARNALERRFWGSDWPKGKHHSRDALSCLPTFPPSSVSCPPGTVAMRFGVLIHRTRTKIPPLRTRVRTADDLIEDYRRMRSRSAEGVGEDRPDDPPATLRIRAPSLSPALCDDTYGQAFPPQSGRRLTSLLHVRRISYLSRYRFSPNYAVRNLRTCLFA